MNKKLMALLTSVCLMGPAGMVLQQTAPQTVQAAVKGKVKVKGKKKVRLYTNKGKKSKYYATAGKKYSYSSKKYLKIGKKKYLAYKIGDNAHWILAKNVKVVSSTSSVNTKATIQLPSGYTKSALLKAYEGKPSTKFIAASIKGMKNNAYSRTKVGSSKSEQEKIDPANLTASQQKELAEFSLSVINSARKQLGLPEWVYSSGTQALADDIAQEYQTNSRGIQNGDHYVDGIVRACQKNGLNLDDNYVEDMAGFSINKSKLTMGEMKRDIYFGIKQMIFGFTGSSESQRNDKSLYREWEHAGDLFNTQGSSHDGDYNYYGFSISKVGNVYSMHFISVPSFIVNSSKYNTSFRP